MSEVRYEIKNFITCYLTWNFDTKKSGLVRTQRTNNDQLILVDPVEDEEEIWVLRLPILNWKCAI
jgi:hypothetical protein